MKSVMVAVPLIIAMFVSVAFGKGDLSRVAPEVITVEMGTDNGRMYFRPNHLDFETGKAYKLVLRNIDTVKHELEANEFVEKVFTRKVQVMDQGRLVAEIKGNVREIEVGPRSQVEWYFVPVQTGKELAMECALKGHKEAGMHGVIDIY
jgi:uncharacterized cupredoxin-like copper-binding protein